MDTKVMNHGEEVMESPLVVDNLNIRVMDIFVVVVSI